MPHVVISCFKADIHPDNLDRLQRDITKLLQQELNCRSHSVSIDLQLIEPGDWDGKIYQTQIAPRLSQLLRKPNYQK